MKIRLITRQFKPKTWAIENASGDTVTEIKKIVSAWKDYCKSLFTDTTTKISMTYSEPSELEPMPLKDEVRAAINHLKRNKAVGFDEIPIETIKAMGKSEWIYCTSSVVEFGSLEFGRAIGHIRYSFHFTKRDQRRSAITTD